MTIDERPSTVADQVARVEELGGLPAGDEERFAGYRIMGLPFTSGHVLAMRRFPASSIGPAYTAIWHRDPDGTWEFWQDQPAVLGCARYFSAAIAQTREVTIDLAWTAPDTIHLAVPEIGFEWSATMGTSPATTALNRVAGIVPDRLWKSASVLRAMGPIAGRAMGVGKVGLCGVAPNGHRFMANPLRVWPVQRTAASLRGRDFGAAGALGEQAALGEFPIPQRGVFVLGRAYFDPPAATSGGSASDE